MVTNGSRQGEAPDIQFETGDSEIAAKGEVDNFLERLVVKLDDNGFLGLPHKRPKMLRNIRNVFERAELTRQEVQTLFGVIESLHRAEPAARDGDSFAVIFGLIKAMICTDMGPWRMP